MSDRTKPLAIVVTGGRTFGLAEYDATPARQRAAAQERKALEDALDRLNPKPVILMHGAAKGADTLAGIWARRKGIEVAECPADWQTHGKAAGPRRNGEMLRRLIDMQNHNGFRVGVVAFPGGTGTADCQRQAEALGIPVWEPLKEPPQEGTAM